MIKIGYLKWIGRELKRFIVEDYNSIMHMSDSDEKEVGMLVLVIGNIVTTIIVSAIFALYYYDIQIGFYIAGLSALTHIIIGSLIYYHAKYREECRKVAEEL